jgi:hypothetical protein
MVTHFVLKCNPLIRTIWVLTGGVALSEGARLVVLKHLKSGVVVASGPHWGNVGHGVLIVGHSVVRVLRHRKLSKILVADSGLAEVDHGVVDALIK